MNHTPPTINAIVEQSQLPGAITKFVLSVVNACRLWPAERAEVTRELCSHFKEGLASGSTPEELIEHFGDPRQAAALLTASKRRNRPLWWRTLITITRGCAALLAIAIAAYVVLFIRFHWEAPQIRRNFTAEYNSALSAAPPESLAWPAYRNVIIKLGAARPDLFKHDLSELTTPVDAANLFMSWLDHNQPLLDSIRAAAHRPTLGFTIESSIAPGPEFREMLALTGRAQEHVSTATFDNPPLLCVLLPHLGELRRLARLLETDTKAAVRAGAGDRFLADIDAMMHMADQCRTDHFLISQLVGLAIYNLAVQTSLTQFNTPGLLNDAQLRRLSDIIRSACGSSVRINFQGERDTIEDFIQRFYSDDGKGDGHLASSIEFDRLYDTLDAPRPRGLPLFKAALPVLGTMLPSRQTLNSMLDAFMKEVERSQDLPMWQHDQRKAGAAYAAIKRTGVLSFSPLLSSLDEDDEFMPDRVLLSRDILLARRDALLTAIAFVRHHRKTGSWPTSLAQLVPDSLPRLPIDCFDGNPLRYQHASEPSKTPTLYSVGIDGVDQGATPAPSREGRRLVCAVTLWPQFRQRQAPVGEQTRLMGEASFDWVLWPEPPEPDR